MSRLVLAAALSLLPTACTIVVAQQTTAEADGSTSDGSASSFPEPPAADTSTGEPLEPEDSTSTTGEDRDDTSTSTSTTGAKLVDTSTGEASTSSSTGAPDDDLSTTSTSTEITTTSTSTGFDSMTTTTGPDPVCGDGNLDEGEDCDDGVDNADDGACTTACKAATCGDGLVQAGVEECDDGNVANTDACSNACKLPSCDDWVENGEETDLDCGGVTCPACADGSACEVDGDCASGKCTANTCAELTLTIGPCAPAVVTTAQAYAAVVQPRCGCHQGGSGGLTMNSAATFKANTVGIDASSALMKRVTLGKLDQSYLLYKVHGQQANVPGGGAGTMPLGGPTLSEAERCTLINWVKSGAI